MNEDQDSDSIGIEAKVKALLPTSQEAGGTGKRKVSDVTTSTAEATDHLSTAGINAPPLKKVRETTVHRRKEVTPAIFASETETESDSTSVTSRAVLGSGWGIFASQIDDVCTEIAELSSSYSAFDDEMVAAHWLGESRHAHIDACDQRGVWCLEEIELYLASIQRSFDEINGKLDVLLGSSSGLDATVRSDGKPATPGSESSAYHVPHIED